jgi:hypothetical protein
MKASLILRQSFAVFLVLLNYVIWRFGVYLGHFGDPDRMSEQICRTSFFVGFALIIVAIIYSLVRRFALRVRRWDYVSPALALLAFVLMWSEIQMSVKY